MLDDGLGPVKKYLGIRFSILIIVFAEAKECFMYDDFIISYTKTLRQKV